MRGQPSLTWAKELEEACYGLYGGLRRANGGHDRIYNGLHDGTGGGGRIHFMIGCEKSSPLDIVSKFEPTILCDIRS